MDISAVLIHPVLSLSHHNHILVVLCLIHEMIRSGNCGFNFLILANGTAYADGNLQLCISWDIGLMYPPLNRLKLFIKNFLCDIRHHEQKFITAKPDQAV